jgi:hypothetical protein
MPTFLPLVDSAQYIDARLLNELISDDGVDADYQIDPENVLYAALDRASEEILSAATRSNAYTAAELTALSTASNGMLRGLTADLALCFLFERRGGTVPESVKAKANRAQERLSDLRDGKRVFSVAAKRDAGTATVQVITAATRGSLVMNADGSFFPTRRTQAY